MKLIKWKVSTPETGLARVVYKRQWPVAYYKNDPEKRIAAYIHCDDSYSPFSAKNGGHALLSIRVAIYNNSNNCSFKTMVQRFSTLKEAKSGLEEFLKNNHEYILSIKKEQL